ncbi:MAG: TetR/AcrR family transcriptional regulator [Porticoccaceae bacterium]|nr:TetR/AcrR family transcriptional regulator [Porticoccaceae bacterium]
MRAKAKTRTSSRLPPLQRRADITAAARSVIAEKGHENISLAEIAQRAGVVEGTLYRFFENKQEMLVSVVADWYKEIIENVASVEDVQGTWNKLRAMVWRALKIIKDNPEVTRFILTKIRPESVYTNTIFYKLNRRYSADISRLCAQAIESGEFREDVSPILLRDMIFGCIEHSTWAYLRGSGDFPIDETADGIANVIYRGMLKEQPAAQETMDGVVERLEKVASDLEKLAKK